ncbi:phosphotransferase enzyme family protein [Pseudozobellia thermophila]|uniref:Ser/Thr protein kinase RdoA involved in Cpx stress response, MazF antagonist n=1 Tax=Pseudozobellia thermophila TaxID=192903 RepID=A0A1M6MYB0_9FLAO|nr:aminoglycoside phosphotransferase family protein [Pseudozobellia thermophila]SHJ88404.1 Ser/Thr protein kinase RdoA involved in Cpx stress response, MazF antagonist [Pseudozobellia thermophila]
MSRYSDKELENLLRNFSVEEKKYTFRPITNGYINDTFLVFDGPTPKYILQRINHKVFENVAGLMNNVQDAFKHLNDDDYQSITLTETVNGSSYLSVENGEKAFWRVMTYIDGSTAYNTTEDPKVAFEAGKVIAKFNILLQKANTADYVDTIPQFHDLDLRKRQFEEALRSADPSKKETAKDALLFTNKVLAKLADLKFNGLPIRVCHNDTKLNNILFSKATKKALCLIDLDTLMRGYFLYDFGDAVRTIVNTAPEDEQDHGKIVFDKGLFDAFVDGLSANVPFLSKREIDTLPWGAVLMPFLHGIRALTDYLNGNIYYKIAYENQNLDRSLSLFAFTQKALDHFSYMTEVTQKKLPSID